ncbi:MAG: sensor histidine kinase [Erysipelotrichaceae bacterium]
MQIETIFTYIFIASSLHLAQRYLTSKHNKQDTYLLFAFPLVIQLLLQIYANLFYGRTALSQYPHIVILAYATAVHFVFKDRFVIKLTMFLYFLFSAVSIQNILSAMPYASPFEYWLVSVVLFSVYFSLNLWAAYKVRPSFFDMKRTLSNANWMVASGFLIVNIALVVHVRFQSLQFQIPAQLYIAHYLMVLSTTFLLYGYGNAVLKTSIHEQTQRQINVQKEYANMNMERLEEVRRVKHDFRHHLHTIANLIHNDQSEAALHYIDELNTEIQSLSSKKYCSNLFVNSIFATYDEMCTREQITFTTRLDIQENVIKNLDLSIILSNTLSNAFEAACKAPGLKEIDVHAKMNQNLLALRITNTYNGQIIEDQNSLLTTKNEQGHGIGMSSIRTIIEKYDGEFTYQYSPYYFTVEILIHGNGLAIK